MRTPATPDRQADGVAARCYETIRDAATGGHGDKPARTTTAPYVDILQRLWIIEPVPAWLPTPNRIARLASPSRHQLADRALAARLLGVGVEGLLAGRGAGPGGPPTGTPLGALSESLATVSVRVFAQAAESPTQAPTEAAFVLANRTILGAFGARHSCSGLPTLPAWAPAAP